MAALVGLHGHSGAGKSTAADHLAKSCGGETVYLGAIVLEELEARNLERNRQNELAVRFDLRDAFGEDVLLVRAEARIRNLLGAGRHVFVDAVLSDAEWNRLQTFDAPDTLLLTIAAPFATRAERLERRRDRPFDRRELAVRDDAEEKRLGTRSLDLRSVRTIINDGSETSFLERLDDFAGMLDVRAGAVSSRDPRPPGTG